MQQKKRSSQLILILSYITLCTGLLFIFFFDKTTTLQQENKKLEQRNEQLELQNSYVLSDTGNFNSTSGYLGWQTINKKANQLVKESGNRFSKSWAIYLVKEAQKYNIDPFLVFELLKTETGGTFNPELVGPPTKFGHAYGLAQFMKNTAPWVAKMGNLPYNEQLLFDPYYSMQLSIVYLDFLHKKYENWNEALTAYHRGMGGLETFKKENGHAKSSYAVSIQQRAKTHHNAIASR
ncbi:soluble lytic murein transglycosylase-like protein [Salirhabdus euzebyi]|uniref:Soluble lytic murein transglycosylase-like protein n=1 Tax=Salirhabdus euzebyi TaxID=394506 RepID=A0A841Q7I8_9BACI|nr:transglycosylase SLT domain-containing protein [Salirhabdus euzebyi]MBB6454294.1 soluble lytic murein transglycosylase-like protein [Salirhabdus euzebyi]